MQRRTFLRAGLLTTAGLALGPQQVVLGATAIKRRQRRKACSQPFFFIQYADPQFGFIDETGHSVEPEQKLFGQAADIINRLHPPFVIATGDYWHHMMNVAEAEAYVEVLRRISPDIKVWSVPGNHDISSTAAEHMAFYRKYIGEDHFYFTYEGCAFIGINSNLIRLPGSSEEARQWEWLVAKLGEAQRYRFIFVVQHISLFNTDADEAEQWCNIEPLQREKYLRLYSEYGVNAVLCGHRHKPYTGKYCGMDMITCGSTGRQLGGFEGMNLLCIHPDRYEIQYKALDNFPKAISL